MCLRSSVPSSPPSLTYRLFKFTLPEGGWKRFIRFHSVWGNGTEANLRNQLKSSLANSDEQCVSTNRTVSHLSLFFFLLKNKKKRTCAWWLEFYFQPSRLNNPPLRSNDDDSDDTKRFILKRAYFLYLQHCLKTDTFESIKRDVDIERTSSFVENIWNPAYFLKISGNYASNIASKQISFFLFFLSIFQSFSRNDYNQADCCPRRATKSKRRNQHRADRFNYRSCFGDGTLPTV